MEDYKELKVTDLFYFADDWNGTFMGDKLIILAGDHTVRITIEDLKQVIITHQAKQ